VFPDGDVCRPFLVSQALNGPPNAAWKRCLIDAINAVENVQKVDWKGAGI
jgi:hypothetical protein